MGYDLRVTRGEGRPIKDEEWRLYLSGDREMELTGRAEMLTADGVLSYENAGLACWNRHPGGFKVWFDLRGGQIAVKYPDDATIGKMLQVAKALGAFVQGDDGEIYEAVGVPPHQPRQSLGERVRNWLHSRRPSRPATPAVVPFAVGQRVRDIWRHEGTVTAIDLTANHGLGNITVRFDDGRILSLAAVAHGLEGIDKGGAA